MTAVRALGTLNRLLTAPPTALALSRRVAGSALANARRSLDDITDSTRDRSVLRDELNQASEKGDLARLSQGACLDLLATKSLGRLAYVAREGHPDIVLVNYVQDGRDILVASAPGPKLQAAERREVVAFQVDDIDEGDHSGWSVLVVGRAERLSPEQAALRPLPEPWAHGPRRHILRIRPQRLDGRRLL